MENLTLTFLVLSAGSTAITQFIKFLLGKFAIILSGFMTKILSWIVPIVTAYLVHAMGLIEGNMLGVLLWGIFSALASNGIYDISSLWAPKK